MFRFLWATLAFFIVLTPLEGQAQQKQIGAIVSENGKVKSGQQAEKVNVTVVNDGAAAIDLYVIRPENEYDLIPTDVVLRAGYEIVLSLELNMRLLAYQSDAVADSKRDRTAFYEVVIGNDAGQQPLVIPDARLFEPVQVEVRNAHSGPVKVVRGPLGKETQFVEMGQLAAGEKNRFSFFPGTEVVVEALDSSIIAKYPVTFDAEQKFDLNSILKPKAELVDVIIHNFSDGTVSIDEVTNKSVIRIAALKTQKKITLSVQTGSAIRFYGGDSRVEQLGDYQVLETKDQIISIENSRDNSIVALPPGIDLSVLGEKDRVASARFLKSSKQLFEAKDRSVAPFIAYNHSDETLWMAGLKGTELIGAKQVRPNSTVNVFGRAGNKSIVWPGDIHPSKVVDTDVFLAINVSKSMNRIVNIARPKTVKFSITNGACKPVDLFAITPFGDERFLGQMHPMQEESLKLTARAHTTLLARAGSESSFSGQKIWSGVVGGNSDGKLQVIHSLVNSEDPLLLPRGDKADTVPKNVRLKNSSSRDLEIYFIEENGRETQLPNGVIGAGANLPFKFLKGDVVVLRRPNADIATSEYARFRVTQEINQEVDIGELRNSASLIGTWVDKTRFAIDELNSTGTNFLSFVATKGGGVSGSMNLGDKFTQGSASFRGCADKTEAFGEWMPGGNGFLCTNDSAYNFRYFNTRKISGGRFSAHRVGKNGLQVKRSACGNPPRTATNWYHLPLHYDDMDPSKKAFERGMFNLTWAPPSFDWLGRGYNLLRVDPDDLSQLSKGVTSEEALFDFIFEDADGDASQTDSKKIFGVEYSPGGSSRCDINSKTVTSLQDLNSFNKKSYDGSVGVPAVGSFSLSKSYEKMNAASTGKERLYIMERCVLSRHRLSVAMRWSHKGQDLLRQPLSPNFKREIAQFPLEWEEKTLKSFIERWGTHFSERIEYGGSFNARTEVSKDTFQRSEQTGDSLSVKASGTLKKVQLGGGFKEETVAGEKNVDKNAVAKYETWSVGGLGAKVYDKWEQTVDERPAPINISFRPVYDILTPVFFPDDPDIGVKNALLKHATLAYFKSFGVDNLMSDPKLLNVPSPGATREICFQLQHIEIAFSGGVGSVDSVNGALYASAAKANGKPANRLQHELVSFDASKLKVFQSISAGDEFMKASCFPKTSENFVHEGSLYLHGSFSINRGSGGIARLSKNIPDTKFSLSDVVPGEVNYVSGFFPIGGNKATYELAIWEQ